MLYKLCIICSTEIFLYISDFLQKPSESSVSGRRAVSVQLPPDRQAVAVAAQRTPHSQRHEGRALRRQRLAESRGTDLRRAAAGGHEESPVQRKRRDGRQQVML